MKETTSPYICHIFVCTNCRTDDEKSCAHDKSREIGRILKKEVKVREWKKKVRVSTTGCMGICDDGPNVMIHPQNIWFSRVTKGKTEDILKKTAELIGKQTEASPQ